MKYVLDASVALKWVLDEADSPQARKLLQDFRSGRLDLLVPDAFPVEIAHALTRAERRQLIALGEAEVLLAFVLASLPPARSSLSLLPRAVEPSSANRVGVYDCLYVALAEYEGCELVTADARLVSNLPHAPIQLLQAIP